MQTLTSIFINKHLEITHRHNLNPFLHIHHESSVHDSYHLQAPNHKRNDNMSLESYIGC